MDKKEIFGVLKRGDIILVIALICFSMLLLFAGFVGGTRAPEYVIISQNGETVAVLPIEKDCRIVVGENEHTNTIVVKDGSVFVENASCPDKLCVSYGVISENGEMILCLPNRLVVRIVSKASGSSDTASY